MTIWQSVGGMISVELTCADVPATLQALMNAGIMLHSISFPTALTVRAKIKRQDLRGLKAICEKKGDSVRIDKLWGVYWTVKQALRRPVLIAGLLLLCIGAIYLPSRVLFIQVSGNTGVSDTAILEQAARCGIMFGAAAKDVRSEQVKNQLLEQIPQLQWAGINLSGCVATIEVKENLQEVQSPAISSALDIYSSRDAIVTHIVATKGLPACNVGQGVSAGQTLISAHMPAGEVLMHTGAAGEIYGDTVRQNTSITPLSVTKRGEILRQEQNIYFIIGKKQINLHNHSGIYGDSCVKIRSEQSLTLPGGYELPVTIVTERITYYVTENTVLNEDAVTWTEQLNKNYVLQQMIAGKIHHSSYSGSVAGNAYILKGSYACNEMIGSITNEEKPNGEDS